MACTCSLTRRMRLAAFPQLDPDVPGYHQAHQVLQATLPAYTIHASTSSAPVSTAERGALALLVIGLALLAIGRAVKTLTARTLAKRWLPILSVSRSSRPQLRR